VSRLSPEDAATVAGWAYLRLEREIERRVHVGLLQRAYAALSGEGSESDGRCGQLLADLHEAIDLAANPASAIGEIK